MRDLQIYRMQQATGRREALLLGQFEFLQTRLEAVERVVKVSCFWDRVKWVIWPSRFLAVVDAVQFNLLAENKKRLESAVAKPVIYPAGVS